MNLSKKAFNVLLAVLIVASLTVTAQAAPFTAPKKLADYLLNK